jgi:ABC-type lipoprotein release transport system permease subunit
MKEDFRIAWRNLWRNRRRTLITSSSVFFAVFFATFMRSFQLGSYDHMISSFIQSFTGNIQVQHVKYQDNPQIDYSFSYKDSVVSAISGLDKVISVTPHIESFTLASSGMQTKGVIVMGIDPVKERLFSNPENKLVKYRITGDAIRRLRETGTIPEPVLGKLTENIDRSYSSSARLELELALSGEESKKYMPQISKCLEVANGYLTGDDKGILVTDGLAGYLRVTIGDSVILLGQGYHGASAAGIFAVRGIIKMPSPEIDSRLIIMTIVAAQEFFDVKGNITSLAVNLADRSDRTLKNVKNGINSILSGHESTARTWYELNPVLYQQIQGDSQSGMAMLGVLYFIIFFGIFGTILMMISERRKEFGVLVAIGMQKSRLKRIVTFEMLLLGALGLVCGLAASMPLILWFYYYPIVLKGELGQMMTDWGWDAIMPTAWFGSYFYWQSVIVLLMVILATLYALRKIGKLTVIEALRS